MARRKRKKQQEETSPWPEDKYEQFCAFPQNTETSARLKAVWDSKEWWCVVGYGYSGGLTIVADSIMKYIVDDTACQLLTWPCMLSPDKENWTPDIFVVLMLRKASVPHSSLLAMMNKFVNTPNKGHKQLTADGTSDLLIVTDGFFNSVVNAFEGMVNNRGNTEP